MKVVFMGTPDIAATVLEGLIGAGHEIQLCVTQPDKARDRNKITFSPVKEKAIQNGIPVSQPEKIRGNEEFLEELKALAPEVICVVAFGQIIPKNIIDLPKYGCINVHASLLPRWRGAAPIQRAILEGDKETGVTIMQIGEGLDDGDMLLKGTVEIEKKNFEEVHDALAELGTRLMIECLEKLPEGKIYPEKQPEDGMTYAKMVFKQEGKIDFSNDADRIERMIRAFDPWPGSFCDYNGSTMKIWKAEVCDAESEKTCDAAPKGLFNADSEGICDADVKEVGEITEVSNNYFTVNCGKGALKVFEIQLPGKKRTLVSDFLRGNKIEAGTILK